jgi:hypothetical protein
LQNEIDSANNKYPKDIFERNFLLLRTWLTMNSSNASVNTLKDVLRSGGRSDIADEIEKMDAQPEAETLPVEPPTGSEGVAEQPPPAPEAVNAERTNIDAVD